MKRGLLIPILILSVAAPVEAQKLRERYAPKDGRFTIHFPGKPKESTQTAKSGIGDLTVVTATYATSDGSTFMASYTDFPEGAAKPENRGTLFDGVRDGIKAKDGKLLSDKAIEVGEDKAPGRDFEFEIEKGKKRMKLRVVLLDGRLFQVAAIGSSSFVKGKDAAAFFESFELTK